METERPDGDRQGIPANPDGGTPDDGDTATPPAPPTQDIAPDPAPDESGTGEPG